MTDASTPAPSRRIAAVWRRTWGLIRLVRSDGQAAPADAACFAIRWSTASRLSSVPAPVGNSGPSGWPARDHLDTITGVGKRAAECVIAEIGADMSVFPDAAHLASWAGRCPGNNVTGGRRRAGQTRRGSVWLGDILTECAWAAARSRGTYLGARFWRLARRIGRKKAAVAVGHSILVIAWHLLTKDTDYEDLGGGYFVSRDAERVRSRAISRLEALGFRVSLEPAA